MKQIQTKPEYSPTSRNCLIALTVTCVLAICARAQEYPRAEVHAGFSYMRIAPGNQVNAFNAVGGLGQFQYNINEALGIVADFGGSSNGNISARGTNFPGDQTQFSYLFGPRVTYDKTKRMAPFIEFEVGGIHNARSFSIPNSVISANLIVPRGITVEPGQTSTKFRSTQNAFAMAIGGGLDLNLRNNLAVRPFQIDYMPSHFSPFNFSTSTATFPGFNQTQWQHNIRVSAGITFRFGNGDVGH